MVGYIIILGLLFLEMFFKTKRFEDMNKMDNFLMVEIIAVLALIIFT